MKIIRNFLVLGLMFFFYSTQGYAESEEINTGLYSAYCSAYTSDGTWAFFVDDSLSYACNHVRQFLWRHSGALVVSQKSGYFSNASYNRVNVRCYIRAFSYYGFGIDPFQKAYNEASAYGYNGCLFYAY